MTASRMVVKVGSSTLTASSGEVDLEYVRSLVRQLEVVRSSGVQVVVVSSGAIAAGISRLGLAERPADMPSLQAAAAVGQVELLGCYARIFAESGSTVAQVLLTRHDTGHREAFLHARDTFERLLELGIVPIVNENDTVAVDEIRFGDNDTLAALVATMIGADLVVLLSDIEGLYDADPRLSEEAHLLEQVDELTDDLIAAAGGPGSGVGSGGMSTKVEAARVLMKAGISMVVCDGHRPDVVVEAAQGRSCGTHFEASEDPIGARKLWIAVASRPRGEITIDTGAREALMVRQTSLLPAGVTAVSGDFRTGDAVVLKHASGEVVGRGLAGMSSDEIVRVMGRKSSDIAVTDPSLAGREVVHRDHLAIL